MMYYCVGNMGFMMPQLQRPHSAALLWSGGIGPLDESVIGNTALCDSILQHIYSCPWSRDHWADCLAGSASPFCTYVSHVHERIPKHTLKRNEENEVRKTSMEANKGRGRRRAVSKARKWIIATCWVCYITLNIWRGGQDPQQVGYCFAARQLDRVIFNRSMTLL